MTLKKIVVFNATFFLQRKMIWNAMVTVKMCRIVKACLPDKLNGTIFFEIYFCCVDREPTNILYRVRFPFVWSLNSLYSISAGFFLVFSSNSYAIINMNMFLLFKRWRFSKLPQIGKQVTKHHKWRNEINKSNK